MESEHVRPDGSDGDRVRATVLVKLLMPVMVIVELPEDPTLIEAGLAVLELI